MRVISQDTPFFLFTFSTALTLQEVSIEHVTIRTSGGRIEDEFEFVDAAGRAIDDPARIDRIKLSVLLTKQFTSFLESAPDPAGRARCASSSSSKDVHRPARSRGGGLELLSDQGVCGTWRSSSGRARSSGRTSCASQYEELLPMLAPIGARQGILRAHRAPARAAGDGPCRRRGRRRSSRGG